MELYLEECGYWRGLRCLVRSMHRAEGRQEEQELSQLVHEHGLEVRVLCVFRYQFDTVRHRQASQHAQQVGDLFLQSEGSVRA